MKSAEFSVRIGRKIRNYRVKIFDRKVDLVPYSCLELKPVDFTAGKIVTLQSDKIVSCLKADRNAFKIVYCPKPTASLDLKVYHFVRESSQEEEDQKPEIEDWIREIKTACNVPRINSEKNVLVFINPKAGKGSAPEVYRRLNKILTECEIDHFEAVFTEKVNHAFEFIRDCDERRFEGGILIISGDGLIHEVLNGLDARDKLDEVPIGVIPCGSANAFATTWQRNDFKGRKQDFKLCQLSPVMDVLRNRPKTMDVMKVVNSKGERKVAFLSLTWGIVADMDIESEPLRMLGEMRFTLLGLQRIVFDKIYKGKLSYLKVEDIPYIDDDEDDDGGLFMESNKEREELLMPPVEEAVPAKWKTEEDSYRCVCVVNFAYLDSKSALAPRCRPNDGNLWLFIIRKEASKAGLLSVLTGVEDGSHLSVPHVEMHKVRAVRLEPDCDDKMAKEGHLVLDGELIDYGTIQVGVDREAALAF